MRRISIKPLEYNKIMPRVAIENLKLIEPDDLVCLIGKDLEAIRCALVESPYGEAVSRMSKDEIDSGALEEVLLQSYVETCEKLVKFSSGNIKNLLLAVLKKFEESNVKTMLRAVNAKMTVDEAMKHIIPVGKMDRDKCRTILLGSKSIEDVTNALINLDYGLIIKSVLTERKRIEDLWQLEVALDRATYKGILESVEKLKGVDKKIAKDVLGIEVDAINVKIILKFKALMASRELINDYLMPTALIDDEALEKTMKATNVKSAIECLLRAVGNTSKAYQNIFTQILKESDAPLSRLESILDNASLKMSLYMLKEYTRYYNIGFVLAFLNLKLVEVKNLRCIINGSERKIPHSQVRKLLTFPDEL